MRISDWSSDVCSSDLGLSSGFRFATEAEILQHFGCKPGYLGPIGTVLPVSIVADRTVANMSDFVSGANEQDFHYTGVNWGRDQIGRASGRERVCQYV